MAKFWLNTSSGEDNELMIRPFMWAVRAILFLKGYLYSGNVAMNISLPAHVNLKPMSVCMLPLQKPMLV